MKNRQRSESISGFSDALARDVRCPTIVAEDAINAAMRAVDAGDAVRAHDRIEYAKYVLIVRRCGMKFEAGDMQSSLNSPGLNLCSGLSNASEMVSAGQLSGIKPILAEAAMRTRALAA